MIEKEVRLVVKVSVKELVKAIEEFSPSGGQLFDPSEWTLEEANLLYSIAELIKRTVMESKKCS